MGKKAKLKGLRELASSLKPFIVQDKIPVYDKLNILQGHITKTRVKNHYESIKQLLKNCNEKEAIVRLDDYVATHQHKILK